MILKTKRKVTEMPNAEGAIVVFVAMDLRSRWFEIFATAELADTRAHNLNKQYKTDRYHVSAVTVKSS